MANGKWRIASNISRRMRRIGRIGRIGPMRNHVFLFPPTANFLGTLALLWFYLTLKPYGALGASLPIFNPGSLAIFKTAEGFTGFDSSAANSLMRSLTISPPWVMRQP